MKRIEEVKEAMKRVAIKRGKTQGVIKARARLLKSKKAWSNCPELIRFIDNLADMLYKINDCNILEKFAEENGDRIRTLLNRGRLYGNGQSELKELECRKQTQAETNTIINSDLFLVEINKDYFEELGELVY